MSFHAGRAAVLGDRIVIGNNFRLQMGPPLIQSPADHAGGVLIHARHLEVKGRTKTRIAAGGGDGVGGSQTVPPQKKSQTSNFKLHLPSQQLITSNFSLPIGLPDVARFLHDVLKAGHGVPVPS